MGRSCSLPALRGSRGGGVVVADIDAGGSRTGGGGDRRLAVTTDVGSGTTSRVS